jgi:hypothetical protein
MCKGQYVEGRSVVAPWGTYMLMLWEGFQFYSVLEPGYPGPEQVFILQQIIKWCYFIPPPLYCSYCLYELYSVQYIHNNDSPSPTVLPDLVLSPTHLPHCTSALLNNWSFIIFSFTDLHSSPSCYMCLLPNFSHINQFLPFAIPLLCTYIPHTEIHLPFHCTHFPYTEIHLSFHCIHHPNTEICTSAIPLYAFPIHWDTSVYLSFHCIYITHTLRYICLSTVYITNTLRYICHSTVHISHTLRYICLSVFPLYTSPTHWDTSVFPLYTSTCRDTVHPSFHCIHLHTLTYICISTVVFSFKLEYILSRWSKV